MAGRPEPADAAEYKQVTVLFADVVHSMDIAVALGPERLREIMADVFDVSAAAVNDTEEPSTSSPATESWPSSARRSPSKTMRCAGVSPR